MFADGLRVSLPTDQIVWADDSGGRAEVRFGGMQFVGIEGGNLVFLRVPDDRLPAGGATVAGAQSHDGVVSGLGDIRRGRRPGRVAGPSL